MMTGTAATTQHSVCRDFCNTVFIFSMKDKAGDNVLLAVNKSHRKDQTMNEWILLTSIVCVKPDVSSSSAYCCPKTVKTHTLVVRFDSIPQYLINKCVLILYRKESPTKVTHFLLFE